MFKAGLTEFDNMALTVLKLSFSKQKRKVVLYRNYKLFDKTLCRNELMSKLSNSNMQISDRPEIFQRNLPVSFEYNCSFEEQGIQVYQSTIINKEIQQTVMVGSNLRQKFLKSRSICDKIALEINKLFCYEKPKKHVI